MEMVAKPPPKPAGFKGLERGSLRYVVSPLDDKTRSNMNVILLMASACVFALGMRTLYRSVREYGRGQRYEASVDLGAGIALAALGTIGVIRYFQFVVTEDWNYAESMTHPGVGDIFYFIVMFAAFGGIVTGIVFGAMSIRSYSRKGALQKTR